MYAREILSQRIFGDPVLLVRETKFKLCSEINYFNAEKINAMNIVILQILK